MGLRDGPLTESWWGPEAALAAGRGVWAEPSVIAAVGPGRASARSPAGAGHTQWKPLLTGGGGLGPGWGWGHSWASDCSSPSINLDSQGSEGKGTGVACGNSHSREMGCH